MPRRAKVHFAPTRSSLVNLPISIYGPFVERGVRPQSVAIHLTLVSQGKQTVNGTRGNGVAPQKEVYVGWTGMPSASSLAQFNAQNGGEKGLETIEIDPQFAEALGFSEGSVVEIGLLHDLGYAKMIGTEPVTADDWDIVELHASHVESALLAQVRVATVGQEIDVWVLGRTRIRLRVVSLEPSSEKALLLTTNTEVTVAPKSHTQGKMASAPAKAHMTNADTHPNGTAGKRSPVSGTASTSKKFIRVFRSIPCRVLPPVTPTCSALEDGKVAAVAYVSQHTLRSVWMDTRSPTSGDIPQANNWIATAKRLPSPTDPTQPQGGNAAPPVAVPKILIPSDPSTSKSVTTIPQVAKDEVLVTWSPHVLVPNGLIVFHGSVGKVEDWDLVNLSFDRESGDTVSTEPDTSSSSQTPRPAGHKLAGVDDILGACTDFCEATFAVHASSKRVQGVPGLLITGRSGSGKTSILNAVARHLQDSPRTFAYTLQIDLSKYVDAPISKIKSLFKYWFEKTQWHRPSVIIMDNMDKLMSPELEHADSFRNRHITELFVHYFGSATRSGQPNARGMLLIASAESKASLHPTLSACHTFQETVHLKPPSKDARKEIIMRVLKSHLDSSGLVQDPDSPLNLTALAMDTEGYSAMDLKDFVARAVHQAAIRATNKEHEDGFTPMILHEDFAQAQADFVPLSLRSVKLHKSDTSWADIGGLQETKGVLRETLEWPTKYGPIFKQSPLRLRQGLLLYGYPGCGKTLLASAVAKECGLNFISVKGPELLNKYIGASEQSVRDLFERASAAKPCVLFFDEFDSIAPKRGHDSTGVTDRVVNQMLTQLDGVEGLDGVYVLAATSRPDLIDSALLRPGRLDKSLLCNMPDEGERREILEAISRKLALAPSVDLSAIARETEGYSGADLQALLYNAHLDVIHEALAHVTDKSSKVNDVTTNGVNGTIEPNGIRFVEIGPNSGKDEGKGRVLSKAEKDAFQRRLQRIADSVRKDQKTGGPESKTHSDVATEKHEVTEVHIQRVLKTTRPSVPDSERKRLDRIYHSFVSERSGDMSVPPEAGGVGHRVTLM